MYKNQLTVGYSTDNNLLKNQRDNTEIIKKYTSRKLKQGVPSETQKYNEYLTYQQPILDELNYIADKSKNNDVEKLKKNYYTLENLRLKKEKEMKDKVDREVKDNTVKEMIKKDLFENTTFIKSNDATPGINTNLEMENKAARVLQAAINRAQIQQTENKINQIIKEEESAVKIEKAILDKVKRNRAKKELFQNKETKGELKIQLFQEPKNNYEKIKNELINKKGVQLKSPDENYEKIKNELINKKGVQLKSPDDTKIKTAAARVLQAALKRAEIQPLYRAGAEYQREVAKKDAEREKKISDINKAIESKSESLSNIPRNKRGRPKGSKDTFKRMPKTKTRTLNL